MPWAFLCLTAVKTDNSVFLPSYQAFTATVRPNVSCCGKALMTSSLPLEDLVISLDHIVREADDK